MSIELSKIPIDGSEITAKARQDLSSIWSTAALVGLVYVLVSIGASIIPMGSILLGGPLMLGLCGIGLKIARGQPFEVSNLFDGFNQFVPALVANLLMVVGIAIGFLLFIVPGIIVALGLGQTYFILSDNPEMTGVDALKESWRMMEGYKADYFFLVLIFIGLAILCIFTLGIGFFWLIPYQQTSFANFYLTLKGDQDMEMDISDHFVD